MTYMQVTTVSYDCISSDDLDWLDSVIDKDPERFVYISDGDDSVQYNFDKEALTLEQVLADSSPWESIVFGESLDVPPDGTKYIGKSYWGDYMVEKLDE